MIQEQQSGVSLTAQELKKSSFVKGEMRFLQQNVRRGLILSPKQLLLQFKNLPKPQPQSEAL